VTVDEARTFLDAKRLGERTLLDVRQDFEYAEGHLPGATHIPLAELSERLGELDQSKPVLAYCHAGMRSLAAANLLVGQGFNDVRSMNGGIAAWNGAQAVGPVDMGISVLLGAATPEEALALAWGMELALEGLYQALSERAPDPEIAALFQRFAGLEERHRRVLVELFSRQSGGGDTAAFEAKGRASVAPGTLEGGVTAEEYLGKLSDPEDASEALELAMAVEAQALDLYLRRAKSALDEDMRRLYTLLAEEERAHLKVLAAFVSGRGRF
jgi:rhodanese-related sulfurtransferase/rubrerythrin